MKVRTLLIGSFLAGALVAGWFGWRWYSAPVPPEVPLDRVEKPLADVVRKARQEVLRQPRSGESWGRFAMILAANHFNEYVSRCYAEAERFAPDNPAWPYLHALHLLEADPGQAIPLMQKALALTRDAEEQAAIHFRLVRALIEDGKLEQADSHLEALRALDPHGPRVQYVLGLLALARGDRAAARELLSGLTESPFIKKHATALLATVVEKDLALSLREQAERMPLDAAWPDPIEAKMRSFKGDRMSHLAPYLSLENQGRHEEAVAFLREIVAERPDSEVCFTLGYALYVRGAFEEAEKMFRAARHYEPKLVKSHLYLGACLLHRGEKLGQAPGGKDAAQELFRQAVAAEDEALKLQSELGLAHQVRGWALKYLRRTDEALLALRRAVLIQPDSSLAHQQLGETLAEAGQLQEGLKHLRYAVQFANPGDQQASKALEKWQTKDK